MDYQTVFQRYELKYILTTAQKNTLLKKMEGHLVPDPYGESTVRSLYYDTDTYRLARNSIERPVYKEKLRLRSYNQVTPTDTVFVELKKKYQSVVYKRRLALSEAEAMHWMSGGSCNLKGQIANEISYFYSYYETLHPVVFLSYDRQAFYSDTDKDLRISFDENIRSRTDALLLTEEPGGERILDEGYVLMELKTAGGLPLWLVQFLTENGLFKKSFSKYGTAYKRQIFPYTAAGRRCVSPVSAIPYSNGEHSDTPYVSTVSAISYSSKEYSNQTYDNATFALYSKEKNNHKAPLNGAYSSNSSDGEQSTSHDRKEEMAYA